MVQEEVNNISHHYERDVKPFLNVIDKLRSSGLEACNIQLPKIAVIGDQSSGKSSVLEALTGVQFPRGTGLVTRCATEVRMRKCKSTEDFWEAVIYSTVDPGEKEKTKNKQEIGEIITRKTNEICKPGLLSDQSIIIEVTGTDVNDLTIIDLPGLTRAKTAEQGEGFRESVEALVMKHIKGSETINLCVVPVNADIATAGSFQFAEEVDPDGIRTIGVLTKVDLIDQGTEKVVINILENITKH